MQIFEKCSFNLSYLKKVIYSLKNHYPVFPHARTKKLSMDKKTNTHSPHFSGDLDYNENP